MLNSICRIRERERYTHTYIYYMHRRDKKKDERGGRREEGGERREVHTHTHSQMSSQIYIQMYTNIIQNVRKPTQRTNAQVISKRPPAWSHSKAFHTRGLMHLLTWSQSLPLFSRKPPRIGRVKQFPSGSLTINVVDPIL
jgi:hypothetical protein